MTLRPGQPQPVCPSSRVQAAATEGLLGPDLPEDEQPRAQRRAKDLGLLRVCTGITAILHCHLSSHNIALLACWFHRNPQPLSCAQLSILDTLTIDAMYYRVPCTKQGTVDLKGTHAKKPSEVDGISDVERLQRTAATCAEAVYLVLKEGERPSLHPICTMQGLSRWLGYWGQHSAVMGQAHCIIGPVAAQLTMQSMLT